MLKVLKNEPRLASLNMAEDAALLDALSDRPILHLYEWENPSISFGYFMRPEKHLHLEKIEKRGIDLARRPTGGGLTFHLWDLAFSFLLPKCHPSFSENSLLNYRFVNDLVLKAVQDTFPIKNEMFLTESAFEERGAGCKNFCMARPTQYDVIFEGRKVAGAAQRKTKKGYLHQGTISLAFPDEDLLKEVLLEEPVFNSMLQFTFALLGKGSSSEDLSLGRERLKSSLVRVFGQKMAGE